MKPRLKPWKNWQFRIIVCDREGKYAFDDFCEPMIAPRVAERLMFELIKDD